MKILLTLIILIPSLSWSNEINIETYDFYKNGYNYHEASEFLLKSSEEDCFLYNDEFIAFRYNQGEPFYLDYDEMGIKEEVIAQDNLVSVIKRETPRCPIEKVEVEIYHNNKSAYKISSDHKGEVIYPMVPVISKDFNDNGLNELLIDYCICLYPVQNYLLFEYNNKQFQKIIHKEAYDWKERLNISNYFQNIILWEEADLRKLIINNLEKI